MFLYPAHGSELIKSYQPEGEVYSQDPDSAIQRELSVEGDMLGLVLANTINLQEYFLPDKATLTLERWEQVTRQFPLPGDTIAVRRARILGHLRKVNGFTRVDIAKAVAQILDLEEDEVVILENSNRFEDDFADATRSAAWQHVAGEGTITEGTNTLTLACQASDTPQWNEHEGGPRARFELRSGEEVEVLARMSTKTLPDDGCKLSVFIQESLNGDAHHVGLMNDGGTVKYFYEKFIDGVATETVGGAASGSALWFRIKKNDDDTVDLGYTTSTDPESFTALATGITSIGTPTIAGVALYNDGGSLSGTQNVVFTEFRTWQPRSDLVWVWYVYRDQLIAGSPDVRGAQSVVNRLKPAHTNGTVCQVEAFLAEDAESLADRDPLGGIFDV
jgi:hypothetical protein